MSKQVSSRDSGRLFLTQYSVNFWRKPSGNSPFPAGKCREIDAGIRWLYRAAVFDRFLSVLWATGSVHQNTASIKSQEYYRNGPFRAELFDMGFKKSVIKRFDMFSIIIDKRLKRWERKYFQIKIIRCKYTAGPWPNYINTIGHSEYQRQKRPLF